MRTVAKILTQKNSKLYYILIIIKLNYNLNFNYKQNKWKETLTIIQNIVLGYRLTTMSHKIV